MLIVMMIEDMLADLGCKSVTSAATVDKALALIDAQAFDVALLDMNLDGDDSYPVAEALYARGVPFAYSTGNTGQSVRDGNPDRVVLKKPFKLEEPGGDTHPPQARADRIKGSMIVRFQEATGS